MRVVGGIEGAAVIGVIVVGNSEGAPVGTVEGYEVGDGDGINDGIALGVVVVGGMVGDVVG